MPFQLRNKWIFEFVEAEPLLHPELYPSVKLGPPFGPRPPERI